MRGFRFANDLLMLSARIAAVLAMGTALLAFAIPDRVKEKVSPEFSRFRMRPQSQAAPHQCPEHPIEKTVLDKGVTARAIQKLGCRVSS